MRTTTTEHSSDPTTAEPEIVPEITSGRRDFLRSAGLGGIALALAACATESSSPVAPAALLDRRRDMPGTREGVVLDFSNDIGVLNFAYALEQLEAAFYIMVLSRPYSGMPERETRLLKDVRDHEIVHRDFFRAALGPAAIPAVVPDFHAIDFTSRTSVLTTARTFEDLGVAAYNGAAHYIANTTYLVVAGKIVSVEARHASAIRDLLQPRTGAFAPKAFDDAFPPTTVIQMAQPFIATPISVINS